MEKKNFDKTLIFPTLALVLSVKSILENCFPPNYFSLVVSVLGIIGGALYLKEKACNHHWLEIWLFLQIPHVSRTMTDQATGAELFKPIVDASQGFLVKFGLHLGSETEELFIGINILPLIIIGLMQYLKLPYQKALKPRE